MTEEDIIETHSWVECFHYSLKSEHKAMIEFKCVKCKIFGSCFYDKLLYKPDKPDCLKANLDTCENILNAQTVKDILE